VILHENITSKIYCDTPASFDLHVKMKIDVHNIDNPNEQQPRIYPNPVVIPAGASEANFSLTAGDVQGRYYVSYYLYEDMGYTLSNYESVVLVLDANDGWDGILFQIELNIGFFILGITLFIWRRRWHVSLPFWKKHPVGLFEKMNYEKLDTLVFRQKYSEIMGSSIMERMKLFYRVPCDGEFVVRSCGIDAALSMRLHLDIGHFFSILTFFSILILIPIVSAILSISVHIVFKLFAC